MDGKVGRQLGVGLIGLVVMLGLAGPVAVLAANDTGEEPVEILDIAPVPSPPTLMTGYPEAYHGMGPIAWIGKDEIGIGDRVLKLASTATFHTPAEMNVSRAIFREGDFVGFLRNRAGEIIAVYKTRKQKHIY